MEIALLIGILVFTVTSFVLQKLPVDVTALTTLALLLVTGLVTVEEAISGFSNEAVIIVLMMFILSDSLAQSGAVRRIGIKLVQIAAGSRRRASVLLLGVTGFISAFINNTAAVAIFMPVSIQVAKHFRFSPSKLLMPLSFASIFGGMCTLIGTSTNLLVSSMAAERGLEPFGVFEFAKLGLVLFTIGMVYNVFFLSRFLPSRAIISSLTRKYHLGAFLTEIKIPAESPLVGATVVEHKVSDRYRLNVLEIIRGKRKIAFDIRNTPLEPDDLLIARGTMEDILAFKEHFGLLLLLDIKLTDEDLNDDSNILMEMQLPPTSRLLGRTLKALDFRRRYGCFVLALKRPGDLVRDKVAFIPLAAWDTVLVFGPRARVEALATQDDFLPLQELDVRLRLHPRWWLSVAVIPAVMILAAVGVLPILTAAILAVVVLLLARVLTIQEAYKSVDWTVIFLLAAILPLGLAIEKTGLAAIVAGAVGGLGGAWGPWPIVALVLLVTIGLTEVISNNSAAVLMVPISISIASVLGVDAKPLVMAVAFGASMSFLTPIGYQTNTMVYGPGAYRFTDYTRAGFPLTLTFWALSSLLIPMIWKF